MQYNLIRNAYFRSLTTGGTGNTDLSWIQLESLMDQNLTSSGVVLTTSGILYLETDLSQRIKVDGIHLYASDLSKSSNIDFYYKNAEGDSYTLLPTYSGTSYYYTTISGASAPQFMRVTVSGIAIELYEFLIYNDDYIVAFGEDGRTYAEHLDNSPVGEEGEPQAIAIYNNDTSAIPATGYTIIDYTGTDADNYVKISASENGTYKGLADGVLLKDNNTASTYIWDMGDHDNTGIENNKLILVDTGTSSSQDKICDLPLTDGAESLNVGESAMAYDSANEVIYALGCEAAPTILKLYKYDIPTNDWTYLWEVNPGITGFENNSGICYLNGYVYIMCDISTYTFGRYNMVTMSGVWEPLTTVSGVPSVNTTAFSMDTDENNYVYFGATDGAASANKYFQRYHTISGTWEVLDNGFGRYNYSSANYYGTMSIACDTDNDCVYSIAGEYRTHEYVSRYDVDTAMWTANYLNRATLGGSPISSCIAYYENHIFLYNEGTTPTAYLYHIPSDSSRSIYVGNPTIHPQSRGANSANYKTFMRVINPRKSNDTMSIIFGCVAGYMDELYGYNMTPVYDRSGTYISPIFKMNDAYSSSYFVVDATTTSGFTSVSYDSGSYNGTIRVRSSATEPLVIEKIYLPYGNDVRRMIPYNGSDIQWRTDWTTHAAIMLAVDRRTGDMLCVTQQYSYHIYIYKFDRNGNQLYYKSSVWSTTHRSDHQVEFDSVGGYWGYGNHYSYGTTGMRLIHLDPTLATDLAIIHENGVDFLHDFAVEMNGDGVWYTNKSINLVYHLDTDGNTLQQIVLQTPRAICGTSDNGCWVMDNADLKVYRYAFNGNLVKTITLTRYADRMTTDLLDGFWYMRDNTIYHVTSEGVEDTSTMVSQPMIIRSMHTGCVVWSRATNIVTCIDFNGNITRTFTRSSDTYGFGVYFHDYTDYLNYHDDILPISYDPVWGTGGSANWKEVRKDGYFLPKEQYHQVELTLRTTDAIYTPYVNKLLMAPAIKIEDIPSEDYKNMYIKTDIPPGVDITDHETKLKTWWKIED